MKKLGNLTVANGTYQIDGQEKTRWLRIGVLFQKDSGAYSIKLDAVPVGQEFDGWVQVFEDKPRGGAPEYKAAPARLKNLEEFDDSIPF
jgi:hypothetical protein